MAKKRRKKSRRSTASGLYNLYVIVAESFVGKLVFFAFVTGILMLAAILVSGNRFDLFFKITGTGLMIMTVISWLIYIFAKE